MSESGKFKISITKAALGRPELLCEYFFDQFQFAWRFNAYLERLLGFFRPFFNFFPIVAEYNSQNFTRHYRISDFLSEIDSGAQINEFLFGGPART